MNSICRASGRPAALDHMTIPSLTELRSHRRPRLERQTRRKCRLESTVSKVGSNLSNCFTHVERQHSCSHGRTVRIAPLASYLDCTLFTPRRVCFENYIPSLLQSTEKDTWPLARTVHPFLALEVNRISRLAYHLPGIASTLR